MKEKWSKSMNRICDANVILRYLMHDDNTLYDIAKEEINKNPIIPFVVLSEIVYVLKGVYKVPRKEIADTLIVLSDEVNYEDVELTIKTLQNYKEYNLDFVDCYLLARNQVLKEEIVTFDKELNNKIS